MEKSTDAKSRISEAVGALLLEGVPAGEITVRQIAEKAGVGIGTINYHFQSKDRLIYEAVSKMLTGMAEEFSQGIMPGGQTPRKSLKNFLIQSSDMLLQHYETYKLQISYEMAKGDLGTPSYIVPVLREIAGS
jgi:AcrR family transcriptional regulator